MEKKVCNTCNVNKSINEYRNRNQCKQCENKIRYQRNKERRLNDSEYNDKWKKYDVYRKRKKENECPYTMFIQIVRQTIRSGIKRKGYTKKSKPLSYEYHISEEGEKIKYIPCNEEHYVEVKKKIKLHSSNKNNNTIEEKEEKTYSTERLYL